MLLNPCFIRYAATNVAENFTQPVDYFDFSDYVKKVPILDSIKHLNDGVSAVIAGGGGIYGAKTWETLEEIAKRLPSHIPIVVWGMGVNEHGRFDRNYPPTLDFLQSRRNVMLGLRDAFYRTYVPCASCMRPEFDAKFTIQHEVGLYVHHQFDMALHYPTMSNQVDGDAITYFWRVLKFMGSCDIVVTNTYHGAYWATLLNRRVIVTAPFSNKFFGFRHEPVIIPQITALRRVIPLARRYPTALSESRAANRAFYERVLAFQQNVSSSHDNEDYVGQDVELPRLD